MSKMRLLIASLIAMAMAGCGSSGGGSAPTSPPSPADIQLSASYSGGPVYPSYQPLAENRIEITLSNIGGQNSGVGPIAVMMDDVAQTAIVAPSVKPGETVTVYYQMQNHLGIAVNHVFSFSFQGKSASITVQFMGRTNV